MNIGKVTRRRKRGEGRKRKERTKQRISDKSTTGTFFSKHDVTHVVEFNPDKTKIDTYHQINRTIPIDTSFKGDKDFIKYADNTDTCVESYPDMGQVDLIDWTDDYDYEQYYQEFIEHDIKSYGDDVDKNWEDDDGWYIPPIEETGTTQTSFVTDRPKYTILNEV